MADQFCSCRGRPTGEAYITKTSRVGFALATDSIEHAYLQTEIYQISLFTIIINSLYLELILAIALSEHFVSTKKIPWSYSGDFAVNKSSKNVIDFPVPFGFRPSCR